MYASERRKFEIVLELQVQKPAKREDKSLFLEQLIRNAKLNGAYDVSVVDSYYVSGKSPERNQIFEIVLSINGTVQSIIKIANSFRSEYTLESLNIYPRIFIKQDSESIFELRNEVNEKEVIEKINEKRNENTLTFGTIRDVKIITLHDKYSEET